MSACRAVGRPLGEVGQAWVVCPAAEEYEGTHAAARVEAVHDDYEQHIDVAHRLEVLLEHAKLHLRGGDNT